MEVRLLGPVEIWADGRSAELGPPQRRHTLAALAVDAGRPVTIETLAARVWDEPPPKAARVLQVHITHLRRLLASAAGEPPARLVRRSSGYVLDIAPERVDVHRFADQVRRARDAAPAEALTLLRTTRSWWRGTPLTGLTGQWVERFRHTYREQYLAATVAWGLAELRDGDPLAVLGPLAELAAEHPLTEPLADVLIRAYVAAGRPADALAYYAEFRGRLADELGVDPSAGLRELHRAVLRGTPVEPQENAATPAQLPADVPGFAGRTPAMRTLDELLSETAMAVAVVSGTAGVGKTALAVHWSHAVRSRFPDGQIFVSLRGFGPTGQVVSPQEALRGLLDALGVAPGRVPATLDAQAALYRSVVAGRRMLVVLDNARDVEQVRPLLPGTATVVVVVTSRAQLTGLLADGASAVPLDLLSRAEAEELLTNRLGAAAVAQRDALDQVITACARLPLALSIAAARTRQTNFPLSALAAELDEASDRLNALEVGDPAGDVRAVLSWSYAALSEPAARLFRLLGLAVGPDIDTPALTGLAGLPERGLRTPLRELTRANLVTEYAPGRYTLHDLLREYAAELARRDDAEDVRRAATVRLLDHYTHSAYAADRLLNPPREAILLPLGTPAAGASPQRFADLDAAMTWLGEHHAVLVAARRHAAGTGLDRLAWQLAWALDTYSSRKGHLHDQLESWQTAIGCAARLGELPARAYAHRNLSQADIKLGRWSEANDNLTHALELFTTLGDRIGQARTQHHLAYLWGQRKEPAPALGHAKQALALFAGTGDRAGQAEALNAIGWYHAMLGEFADTLTYCRQALDIFEADGDLHGATGTWDSLGYAHHHLGHHAEAIDCYRQGITLARTLQHDYFVAELLVHLGDTYLADGRPADARTAWTEAEQLFTALDHPGAAAVRDSLRHLDGQVGTG
ncbi:AfsR/SARP family transcriptional regulator [Catenuloplanes indicus]|uniref:DNA-binding SARP family transcriptional activator/tetratricopeptide (TPR) repeat protein n=1 Tax=Catenuloplanes indicus TaxID=137267 RepID=A0AAE3VXT0_9ACTN|nr:BTAD domain-containing putative transcriptional regulator [Catenuloplanes indicus]MDQ0364975.1 DNA-binding SARP family transcriptional activator/tetratricopeptide (TPR) repeat protein [Catenuloplanes indicus]